MLLFKALNTSDVSETRDDDVSSTAAAAPLQSPTQSKKVEAEANLEQTFRSALTCLGEGEEDRAVDLLQKILDRPHLKSKTILPKDLKMKYACLKNLVIIHERNGRFLEALECGIQAMEIDSEEIPLIFRLGRLAQRLACFDLALLCFRAVLDLRSSHWPGLDALLRLTFAMGRFEECLQLCADGLQRDRYYRAAWFCAKAMLTMQPSLVSRFEKEVIAIIEDEEMRKYVEEDANFCADMREFAEKVREELRKKTEALKSAPLAFITFEQPLAQLRWSTLLQAFKDKYFELLEKNMIHMTVDVRTLVAAKATSEPEPPKEPMEVEKEMEEVDAAQEEKEKEKEDEEKEKEEAQTEVATADRPRTPEPIITAPETKKLSPVDQISKIVRQGVDETLVEKRRSSRACVVSAWGANRREAAARAGNDASDDSVVGLLNGLLFEELWDLAQEDSEEGKESDEMLAEEAKSQTTEGSNRDSPVRNIDDGCEEEVSDFLAALINSTLMHHLSKLLLVLGSKFDRRWPRSMVKNYLALFEPIFGVNFQHQKDVPNDEVVRYIEAYLLALELQADRTQTELQAKNCLLQRHEEAYPRFPHLLMVHEWLLRVEPESQAYKEAHVRIRWLDYVWQLLCGDRLMAERSLSEIDDCFDEDFPQVNRPTCLHASIIDAAAVSEARGALSKCVGVERLRALSQEKRHAELLSAWVEDAALRTAELTVVHCEVRRLVHRAFAFSERWQEGFRHGIRSLYLASRLLHNEEGLENSGLTPKSLLRFSWRSLRITAICWEAMPEAEQKDFPSGELARLILASCQLVPEIARRGARLLTEELWRLLHAAWERLERRHPSLCRPAPTRDREEDVELPASLLCLHIGHEYLAANRCCGRSRGRLLTYILHAVDRAVHAEGFCGDVDDVEFLFLQALFCLHGITRKCKGRAVGEHHAQQLPLKDYATMQLVYAHFRPDSVPEFDSVKSLSIGPDMVALAKAIVNDLPRFEDRYGLSEDALEDLITGGASNLLNFKANWKKNPKAVISKDIYYLLADHHFKNRAVAEAVTLYRRDLRFNPLRFDSWAALSLTRLSVVQKGLDQKDYSQMADLIKDVNICMRSFECALTLNNKCSKLMVENGTLAYEIFSYADKYYRQWQLRGACPSVPLLTACCQWRKEMLAIADLRFRAAIETGPEEEQELWYYSYMRGKCAEKMRRPLFTEVMPHYHKAVALLQASSARYPRRVFFYGAIPTLSLEAVEVFYRCHAALLKRLLFWSKSLSDCEELDRIEAELLDLAKSDFAVAERSKAAQKRGRPKTAAPAPPVPGAAIFGARRSKRARLEAEGSAPTSEAEGEIEAMAAMAAAMAAVAPKTTDAAAGGATSEAQAAAGEALESLLTGVELQLDVRDAVEDLTARTVSAVGDSAPDLEDLKLRQWQRCLGFCFDAFELLVQRCPHHYKSVRQAARMCLCVPSTRNVPKALEYLWCGGTSDGGKFPLCALFKDRKGNNLFHGIYRNPIHDLDRCGNFSHHISNCVDLLLRGLRERCDWAGLKEVCLILLASIPEVKNVCVTDADLKMLQKRAFVFCLRSIEQQLLRPQSIEWPLLSDTWLGRPRSPALPLYRLYRVFRLAERSFPELKTEAFSHLARTFLRTGVQVREKVPLIDQIKAHLRVDS